MFFLDVTSMDALSTTPSKLAASFIGLPIDAKFSDSD